MNTEMNNSASACKVRGRPRLFELGSVVATPAALDLLQTHGVNVANLLEKHQRGEWGASLSANDARANDLAVQHGGRILSAFNVAEGKRLWIITEADRSVTTILKPEDY